VKAASQYSRVKEDQSPVWPAAVQQLRKISSEDVGRVVGFLYTKYLKEVKKLNEKEIEKRVKYLLDELITKIIENEEKIEKNGGSESDPKFALCHTFSTLYSGNNMIDENVRGKEFAAFKLAKAIVKADLVGHMLKEFKIDFSK